MTNSAHSRTDLCARDYGGGMAAGGTERSPVGTVYVALADGAGSQVHRQFLGDRARIRQFTTQMALDMLQRKCARLVRGWRRSLAYCSSKSNCAIAEGVQTQ